MPIFTEVPAATAAPVGPAGGDLTGTFPNPTIGAGKVVAADIAAGAAASNVGAVGGALTGTLPNPTIAGTQVIAPQAVAPVGLAGAVAASRYVGATASGAPAAGTFAVGDFVLDQSGQVWICVAAGTPGSWRCATKDRAGLALTARGLLAEPFSLFLVSSSTTIASGVVYGFLVGLRAGDPISNLVVAVSTAASGTAPTLARFGVADSTGKMLAVSADLGAAANWAQGQRPMPVSYAVTVDGGYYLCFIVNGTWSVTQPTLGRTQPQNAYPVLGANAPYQFQWAGQADLPAVNSSLTITAGAGTGYWIAAA